MPGMTGVRSAQTASRAADDVPLYNHNHSSELASEIHQDVLIPSCRFLLMQRWRLPQYTYTQRQCQSFNVDERTLYFCIMAVILLAATLPLIMLGSGVFRIQ